MAYGSADSGYGAAASVFHPDASHADSVFIPDADLLFNGAFTRHGPDLILTGHNGDRHVVPGYFSAEHHPALVAPNGARLSADLVDLLAGSPAPNEYAQAASTTPASPIGKVEKIAGHVVVFRNGVEVALNVGDAVYKGDVIQTGVNSACGVDFPDGTALNLVANTRMALSEFSFDPNGHSNDALFSLVQGTFAFVAGKVAHTGDMKIETPVATMGIRGTTGFVQEQVATISANAGNVTYSFAVVEDYATNRVGSYELVDDNPSSPTYGQVIATVSQNGFLTFVTPQGSNLPPIVTTQPMTNSQLGFEQQIIDDLFAILNSSNANPQSTPGAPGSSTPPDDLPRFLQLLQNDFGNTYTFNVANGGYGQIPVTATINGGGTPPNNPGPGQQNSSNIFIWSVGNGPGTWIMPTWSQPGIPNAPIDTVEVLSGPLFYNANYTIGSLYVAPGVVFDITGGSLTVLGAVIDDGTISTDPAVFKIEGPLTVGTAGHLRASGAGDIIDIDNSADNLGIIAATHRGKIVFDQSDLTNQGTLKADDHGTISFANTAIDNQNGGRILAKDGGVLWLNGSNVTNELGAVFGAFGGDSRVDFVDFGSLDNSGTFFIADRATAALGSIQTTNEEGAHIDAVDHACITIAGGTFDNYGEVLANNHGQIAFGDLPDNPLPVTNYSGGKIEAKDLGSITFDNINVTNDSGAAIIANRGLVEFKEIPGGAPGGITNWGFIAAKDDGTVKFFGIGAEGTGGLFNNGTIAAIGCGSTVDFYNSTIIGGTLKADGGEIFVDCDSTLQGSIGVSIGNGGLAHFADVINANNADITVTFSGAGTLRLDQAPSTGLSATLVKLSDFWVGDVLDLTNLSFSQHETAIYCDGVLTVIDGCNVEQFALTGDESYNPHAFVVVSDGHGGSEVVYADVWTDPCGGCWTSAGNWSSGVPGSQDTVLVDEVIACHPLTVTLNSCVIVANLLIGTGVTLDVLHDGSLTVYNEVKDNGTIESTDAGSTIRFDGPVSVAHDAEILASGHDAKIVFSDDTVDNAGTIEAERHGAIQLFDTTITGGTLETDRSGIIEAPEDATFVNVTLAGGNFETNTNFSIDLQDTTTLSGAVTFEGGGTFELSGGTIHGPDSGDDPPLENDASTIAGYGTIGDGTGDLTLLNDTGGTINATGGTLTIDTGNTVINAGVLEATAAGVLDIQDVKINNTGTGAAGILIDGTSELLVDTATLKLTGSGDVTLAGGSLIDGNGTTPSPDTLDNVNNTITGAGTIGDTSGDLALTNAGIIDATGTLTIETGANAITNTGTLEATNGGIFDIDSTVNNAGGLLQVGSNSAIDVVDAITGGKATIDGGTLEFDASSNVNVTFIDGGTAAPYGELKLVSADNWSTMAFTGTISGFDGTGVGTSDTVDLVGFSGGEIFSDTHTGHGANEIFTLTLQDTNGQQISVVFKDPGGTLAVTDSGNDTIIYDPPATNSSSPSASLGSDSFVFHTGANGGNTGTSWDAGTNDHADWAHTHQEWSQLAGDMNGAVAAEIAQHAESHWHYALHGAEHLH